MPAPFVISMKLLGDASSGVAAVKQQQASLEALEATAFNVQMNTANIAAQFQDIGVTAAMGMNPLMIALQQGTQLSAAIGSGRGLAGTVSALGAAFASIVNPVSLATIAVVGLGAAGVQALMGMMNSTEDATASLEEHADWLDEILAGYEHTRTAAEKAAAAAQRLPRGVVASDLEASLRDQEDRARAIGERVSQMRRDIEAALAQQQLMAAVEPTAPGLDLANMQAAIDLLDQFGLSATMTSAELGDVMSAARDLLDTTDSPIIRQLATDVFDLAEELRKVAGAADMSRAALEGISDEATTAALRMANLSASFDLLESLDFTNQGLKDALQDPIDAMEKLRDMVPDVRTAADLLNEALSSPSSAVQSEAQAVYEQYLRNTAIMEGRRAARTGEKSADRWDAATRDQAQRLEQARLEVQLLGASTFEAERQRTALELLNKAREAGIPITDQVLAQVGQLSSEYAASQAELEAVTEAQQRANEELDFYRGTFNSFALDLKSGLMNGTSLWGAFGNAGANALDRIADRTLGMAADGIFDLIFGAVMGGIGGGLGGGVGFSRPGNFSIGGMASYAAGTSYHPGGLARVHGEEIIELPRGTRVHSAQSAAGMSSTDAGDRGLTVIINNTNGSKVETKMLRHPGGKRELEVFILDTVRDASRRGAPGF